MLVPLRAPDVVMRLDRLGAAHPTRLSFLRAMLRRAESEDWRFSVPLWDLDSAGHGRALLAVTRPSGATRWSVSPRRSPIPTARTG
jgi:hypothetical protein